MSTSGIHGGRVKEPKIVRRTVLPVESKRASTLAGLTQAWSTFGEAKNVLQRLESRAVSPPVKDKRLEELKNHKKVKPHGVHFNSTGEKVRDITGRSMGELHGRRMTGRDTQALSTVKTSPRVLFSDDSEKENVVAGTVLNEHGAGEGRNQDVQERSETVRLGQAASHGDVQHQSQTGTVRHATVAAVCPICSPPRPTQSASHNPTTSPSVPASSCLICSPPPPPYSASSNPNVMGLSRSPTHLAHANPRAVFGPPVSFGSQQTSTATVSSRQPPQVVQERPLLHTRKTHSTHSSATQRNMTHDRPITEPIPGIGRGQASLRKFELPTDMLSALREKIEQQKKAVQATAAQVGALTQKQPNTTTAKFYPLPEASITSNSSTSYTSPPHSHLMHPVPPSSPPPQYSHPVKRRKVVSVPPPQSYRGFTAESGEGSGAKGPLQWRPLRVRRHAAVATSTAQPSGRARKVQRVATSETVRPTHQPAATRKVASGTGQSTGATITTSSWRVGKKLTDQILKQQPGLTKSNPVADTPAQSHSLPTLTRDTNEFSSSPPAAGFHTERGVSPLASPPSSSGEGLVRGSTLPTTAAKLLEDLEMLSQDEERAKDKLSRPKRYNPVSLDSAAKKPRFNFEPVYPTQKARHYDQAEIQQYMQRKQEERLQKTREEQLARDQVRQERQQRLRELYQQQKRTLAANLQSRQRQRETYSKALSSAPVHVHILESSRSESEAGSDEITHPLLTITPPRDTTHYPSRPLPARTPPRGADATSPARHSPTLSPGNPAQYTQPPNTSPISVRSNQQGSQSPYSPTSAHLRSQSHSPVSPRTYSIPRISPSFAPSPRREGTTSQPPSVHTYPTAQAERSYGTQPPSGELTSLLRGSSSAPQATRAAAESIDCRSREERIQQLTITALKLKQRIAAETKKLSEGSAKIPSGGSSPRAQSLTTSPPVPQHYHHKFAKEPQRQPTDLPGVHNLHQHALQAELARREGEAALKIQAAYKGHKVRQSLQWRLPSGVPGLRGAPVGSGGDSETESDVEDGGHEVPETQLMAENGPLLEPAREEPLQVSQSCPLQAGAIPPVRAPWEQPGAIPPVRAPWEQAGATPPVRAPWEQAGGDAHSVINVFIERQKQLQVTLAELKNRKLEELKQIRSSTSTSRTDRKSPGASPLGAGGTSPFASTSAPAAPHEGPQLQSYSYSQTFETTPSKDDDDDDDDDGSLVSDLFSVDSLVATTDTHAGVTSVRVSTSEPQAYITTADLGDRQTAVSTLPATESCNRNSQFESTREMSAITPPGSPSFVESFSNQKSQTSRKQQTMPPEEPKTGRLSPRSLELRLQAELRLLDTVEESMRHLSSMESTRVISLAQQETVTLAQLLKSRQQKHESEVQSLATQAKQEVEDAQRQFDKVHQEATQASERIKRLQEEADAQAREHMKKLTQMQEASSQASNNASKQLAEARCTATTAVIEAAQQQMEAAHKMAVSAASAAAQQAVKAAMGSWVVSDASKPAKVNISQSVLEKRPRGEESVVHHSTDGVYTEPGIDTTYMYTSDFNSSTAQAKTQEGSSIATASDAELNHSHSSHDSSIHESLTPVPSHEQIDAGSVEGGGSDADRTLVEEEEGEEEVDESLRATTPEEQSEEDIDEVSFRELLPSEGHRRQRSRWLHSSESESHVSSPAPSQGEHSRSRTPTGGELSPFNTEDSFFQFTSRMVRQYMREEELRAKHQATLLQLREQALQERTQAELEWLELKKQQQLRTKGADELAPSLLKRERGLRKKLQQEQAEIRKLQEAQKTASHERKLMLLQQQEISKMKKSAKYYQEKIRSHRRGASPMSTPREFSPSPSLEDSGQALEETMSVVSEPSVTEELSEEPHAPTTPQQHSTPAHTPTHSLTFPTYIQEDTPTAQPQPVSEEIMQEGSTHTEATPTGDQRQPTADTEGPSQLLTPGSSSITFKKLKKLTSADAEKYLTQRERWLLKRRHMAEEALRQQQELLEREQRLEREEEEVGRLVDQALQCYQSRRGERKPVGKTPRSSRTSAEERIPRETSDSHPEVKSGSHPREGSDSHPSSVAQSHASLGRQPTTSATSASITEDLSEEVAPGSGRARSESGEGYSTDTFESLEATPTPPPSTSTPAQPNPPAIGDLSLTGSVKTSDHSISDSAVTASSERSALEARIHQLRERLQQRKEEVRRVQSEQRRKKKALLRQQEENLKRKLEVVENVLTRARKAPATPPPVDSAPSSEGWPSSPEPTPPPTLRDDTMAEEEGFQAQLEPAVMATDRPTDRPTDTRATDGRAPEETPPSQFSNRAPPFKHSLAKPATASKPQETQSPVSTQAYSYKPFPQNIHSTATELGKRVPVITSGDVSAESIPEEFEYNSRSVPGVITPQEPLQNAEPLIQPMEEPSAAELGSLASSIAEEGSYSPAAPPEWPQEPSYTETFEAAMTLTELEEAETGQEVQGPDKTGKQFEILPSSVHDESPPLSIHDESPQPSVHDESPPLSIHDENPPLSAIDESPAPSIHDESPPPSFHDEEEQPVFHLGQRVLIASVMAGTVRYTGNTHFAEGLWIGVELDLPKGINDGSRDGQRYFSCEPNHGLFAPPSKVSLLDEEEEEEEEEGSEGEGSVEEEIESSLDKSNDQFWEEGAATVGKPRDSYTPDFEPSDEEESTPERAPPSDKKATPEPASVQDVEGNIPEQLLLSDEAAEDHPSTEATELQLPALSGDIAQESSVIPQVALEEEAPSGQSPVLPIMPAFAPPPGFEGEASRESSEERELLSPQQEKTDAIVGALTQDLSNEAFETVHRVWRNKQRSTAEVVVYKDKEIPLTLEEKADKITDELLALLIQSETNLVCNIRSAKTSHSPEPMDVKANAPKNRELPARLIIPTVNIESSPPPISPPSTFRGSPPPAEYSSSLTFQGSPPPAEYSPPGSPPRHLSQASAARVAAGDKSPFLAIQQEPGSPPHSRKAAVAPRFIERSNSLETITELMESVRFKTPRSTVPSELKHVDRVVEEAWNAAQNVGLDSLHSTTFKCPQEVLSLFRDTQERKINQAEDKCRAAYLQLVYMLSIETLRDLYPPGSTPRRVWAHQCAIGGTLVRWHSRDEATALEQVQKKVFATLMKGKLPPQLPAVKFLHGMKRPGGREIDFVDSTLIRELREEEPGWVDYTEDEVQVKTRTADAILDSLLTETVQVLMDIERKHQRHA